MIKNKAIIAAMAGILTLATASPSLAYQHNSSLYRQERTHNDRWERQSYARPLPRYQRYQQEHVRRDYNNDAIYGLVAGIIIGAVITDRNGERRQYYRDQRSGTHFYYNYDRQDYAWDYNYRPGY